MEAIALELELSGKNGSRYHKVFSRYRYQGKFHGVWYIVSNKSLGQRIEREWQKINSDIKRPKFRWLLLADVFKTKQAASLISNTKNPAHTGAHRVGSIDQEKIKEIAS